MSDPANDDHDDAVTMEVDLDAPPDRVWRALAEPALREAWLGEAQAGPARIAGADPGRRLDLVWPQADGESRIRFEIAATPDGSRLTIVHQAPSRRGATMGAGAWRMAA